MAKPLKPFIRGGGYLPSRKWTPLVYPGGYTTMDGGDTNSGDDSEDTEDTEETEGE